MSNWMIRSADVLEILLQRLKITLLTQAAIHADETPVVVIADDNQKSYMWVYCSGRDSPDQNSPAKNIVIYDYQPSREGICPKLFLGDYKGYLQVDGYAAYASTSATLAGCMGGPAGKSVGISHFVNKVLIRKAILIQA